MNAELFIQLWAFDPAHYVDGAGFTGWRVVARRKYDGRVVLGRSEVSAEGALEACKQNIAELYAQPTPRQVWEKKRDEVLGALADGHPNPEGYMEWWFSHNPPPS